MAIYREVNDEKSVISSLSFKLKKNNKKHVEVTQCVS